MRTRVALLGATALVATSWLTTQYDTFPRVSGYTFATSGIVYKRLGEFDRLDFITASTVVFLTTTGGTQTWPVPGDCPATVDSAECIGGGAGGANGTTPRSVAGGPGGAGAAYAKVLNLAVSGSVSYSIGAAGAANLGTGGDTWFKSTSDVLAKGGAGTTGSSVGCVGSTVAAGGNGGSAGGTASGGGGGAGGPNGAGNNGVSAGSGNGGSGDAGSGGTGGTGGALNTAGGAGAEYTATAGGTAGSGGGGGGRTTSAGVGKDGGNYGGGGGGGTGAGNAGGLGAQGLSVITYTPTGGATLVVGWLRRDDDKLPVAAQRFQPPAAIALTPPATPSTIAGIAWFEPPDQRQPRPLEWPHPGPAITLSPPALLSTIQGIGWFNPFDELPRPPPRQQPNAAIALTPDTLPPQIAGMAWFEPPDSYQPRRFFVQDAPAYAPPATAAAVVAAVYGWWPIIQEPLSRKLLTEDRPAAFAFTRFAVPTVWTQPTPELPLRAAAIFSIAPAFAFTPRATPPIWTQPFPETRPHSARSIATPPPALGLPATLVTPSLFGIGWFVAPEIAARQLNISFSAPPPQMVFTSADISVTVVVDWLVHARRTGRR